MAPKNWLIVSRREWGKFRTRTRIQKWCKRWMMTSGERCFPKSSEYSHCKKMQKSCTQYVCITIKLCAGILTLATFFFKFLFPLFKAKHLHRKIQTTKFEPNNIRQYQSICKLIKYCPTVQPSCFFASILIGWFIKFELAEFSQCYTTVVKIVQVRMLHMNTL